MRVNLVPIGNSKGVRLPRSVIRECGFRDQIEMRVERGTVVLAPARGTREGWAEAFARMAAGGGDELLLPDTLEHAWDRAEWEW